MPRAILTLLVLITAVFVLIFFTQPEKSSINTVEQPLFPDLVERVQQIDRIDILNSEGILFQGEQVNGQWQAAHWHDYPIYKKKLSVLVQQLVEATQSNPRTRQSNYYEQLGVEDIQASNAMSTQVDVYAEGALLLSVIVGNSLSAGSEQELGTYVRRVGDSQVWKLNHAIELPVHYQEWLRPTVFSIALDEVHSLTLKGKQGWAIQRGDKGEFVLDKFDSGQLVYQGVLEASVNDFISLPFERIHLAKHFSLNLDDKEKVHNKESRYSLLLKTGETLNVRFVEVEAGNVFVKTDSDDENHHSPFVYEVMPFKVAQFNKPLHSFVR